MKPILSATHENDECVFLLCLEKRFPVELRPKTAGCRVEWAIKDFFFLSNFFCKQRAKENVKENIFG